MRGPRFLKFLYEAQISEAANKFATLISTEAIDPEGDLVRYAIVGGNEAGHFLIEESTGEIRVATSLDRETQERYSLVRICFYSSVPNKLVGWNNPVGWIFHGKLINV